MPSSIEKIVLHSLLILMFLQKLRCQPLQGIETICQWQKLMEKKVEGVWLAWSEWSKCMTHFTCDGIRTRNRKCLIVTPLSGSSGCPGNKTETKPCVLEQCNVFVAPIKERDAIGGNGGYPFSDSGIWGMESVTGIRMQCGRVLVSMQLKYGDRWGPVRGGNLGGCAFKATYSLSYEFDPNEYVIAINATHDTYINSVILQTNKRILKRCGTTTGSIIKNIQGNRMVFISGRHGCYVDKLYLHWAA